MDIAMLVDREDRNPRSNLAFSNTATDASSDSRTNIASTIVGNSANTVHQNMGASSSIKLPQFTPESPELFFLLMELH